MVGATRSIRQGPARNRVGVRRFALGQAPRCHSTFDREVIHRHEKGGRSPLVVSSLLLPPRTPDPPDSATPDAQRTTAICSRLPPL
ncbi:hypothetical protein X805_29200 [Sphaerotilus natans subsp. natans DSM 6575]|uniref:Uncharacterized protein n=1 Tax=Sphaerotilus natans subsp. natans DSM 6575 TaxID=1286631 RepID=A0A059KJV4_9BURK|nr:hypothetical protein X805_29200 [Sphaerotilus natans subsp. natans DSM 6575]